MPIRKRWSDLTADRIRRNVPARTGIYELRSDNELVFIGRARTLQRVLMEEYAEEEADGYRFELVDFLGNEKRHRTHVDNFVRRHDRYPAWVDARPCTVSLTVPADSLLGQSRPQFPRSYRTGLTQEP